MGKNWVLDACHTTAAVIVVAVALAACSVPRVVLLHDPLTPEEHLNLGVSYENRGEFEAALREYKAATRKLPVAYLYLGNVYFQQNDFYAAEGCYKKAVKKTRDPRAYNNLAWLYYLKNENLQEAERLAETAVELSPGSHDFMDTLSKIREKRERRN